MHNIQDQSNINRTTSKIIVKEEQKDLGSLDLKSEFNKDQVNLMITKVEQCINDLRSTLEKINPKLSTSFMLIGANLEYNILDNSELNDSSTHNTQLLFKLVQHLLLMKKYLKRSLTYFTFEADIHKKYSKYSSQLNEIRKRYELLKRDYIRLEGRKGEKV